MTKTGTEKPTTEKRHHGAVDPAVRLPGGEPPSGTATRTENTIVVERQHQGRLDPLGDQPA